MMTGCDSGGGDSKSDNGPADTEDTSLIYKSTDSGGTTTYVLILQDNTPATGDTFELYYNTTASFATNPTFVSGTVGTVTGTPTPTAIALRPGTETDDTNAITATITADKVVSLVGAGSNSSLNVSSLTGVTVDELAGAVGVDKESPKVGETVTATLTPTTPAAIDATTLVKYQWYTGTSETAIDTPVTSATAAAYNVVTGDKDKFLKVTAKVIGYNGTTGAATNAVTEGSTTPVTGAVSTVGTTRAGLAKAKAYTLTVGTEFASGRKLTLTNVATSALELTQGSQISGTGVSAQAGEIADALNGATGAKYYAVAATAVVTLYARPGADVSSAPTAAVDQTGTGAATLAAAATSEVEVYTVQITTELGSGDTLTFTNVADASLALAHSTAISGSDIAVQAGEIATAINGATTPKFAAFDDGTDTIVLYALGAITAAPTAALTATGGGGAIGAVLGQAIYSFSITTALATGEKITVSDAATGNVVYTATASSTAAAQATALVTALNDAGGAKYTATSSGAVVTLTAKNSGTTVPTVAVTAAP